VLVDLIDLPWFRMCMTKKRFSFAQIDEPAADRSIGTGPRVFLAAMVAWAGLSGLFLPVGLASEGPVRQLAMRFTQEWQLTIEELEVISLKAEQI
jgi:hypothetical protein